MRRRAAPGLSYRVPVRLRRFVPGEWPGSTTWRQYEAWAAEVDAYLEGHPDAADAIQAPASVSWDPEIDPP